MTPDGLIDEDYEEHFGSPSQVEVEDRDPESEFRDIAKYGVVQVAGASLAVSLLQKMFLAHLQDMYM